MIQHQTTNRKQTMITQVKPRPSRLEPALESLLARLRRRIRAYVWADGLAVVVALVAGGFWVSLALDWVFEPPRSLRIAALAAGAAALVYVIVRFLLLRLWVRLADRNMALLVERRFGQFRDSLMTAVELSQRPDHAAGFNVDMLAHTHRDALARAAQVDLREIFNAGPLARHLSLAIGLVVAMLVFALAVSNAFGVWARRSLQLSDELWPRQTRLTVEGFDEHREAKIARGSAWSLLVKADTAVGSAITEIVEVR
jgi:hypothetical protein